ncbi:MAG: HEAT repeat domain-containing protein [Vulcanimicrobiota bacterium]
MRSFPLTLILLIVLTLLVFPPCYRDMFSPIPPAKEEKAGEAPVQNDREICRKALEIIEAMQAESDYRTRLEAAAVMHKAYGDADLYGLCGEALLQGNVCDRMEVLQTLIRNETLAEYSARLYKELLNDSAYVIRERAVYHLSLNGDSSNVPVLRKALEDEDYYVRAQAAKALGRCGDKDSIPVLREHLIKESGWTALCFAQALTMLGDDAGRSILVTASSGASSANQRAYGLAMRYEAGEHSLLPALCSLLNEQDDRAREIVCRYLARLVPTKEKDVFTDILARGDMISVKMALERLSEFSPSDRDDILRAACESSSDKRKALFSLATDSPADAKTLLSAIKSLHLRDNFSILMKDLSRSDRKLVLTTMESLLKEAGMAGMPDLRTDIVKITGFTGPDEDGKSLALLEPFLDDRNDELKLCAAISVIHITAPTGKKEPSK